ncbi:protein ANTAGONIST OF LIKE HETEROCHROMATIN PROTEIN 1-like [Coffea arabica]|uniref:Protein ANTAGONIST OF LIKE HETEROCHROMATIN PROTEIN 1-like n=1 Tax=Coffea arabica TaxID=13443 RepID=A0ABM4UFG5_COFAR
MARAPPNFGVNLDDPDDARQAATAVLILSWHFQTHQVPRTRQLVHTCPFTGQGWVDDLLGGKCIRMLNNMRMNVPTFIQLCRILREGEYIIEGPCDKVTLEEGVAIGLYGLSHDLTQRMLDATHPRIRNNRKFYPWFKDCIGAIDGTHVSASVPRGEQDAFRNRKGTLSQNVLAACDHDMRFVYVRAGWEGSAHDSRVLLDAISNPDAVFPTPPAGKYYAVDAAYRHMPGLMAPFKSGPGGRSQTAQKGLFNRRHSSVRNIIERTFGVWKMRFKILDGPMKNYPIEAQRNIVVACCVLHNFIREMQPYDVYLPDEVNMDGGGTEGAQMPQLHVTPEALHDWKELRNAMADHMYLHRNE